eukprot:scaffold278587_cov29-Prasinocladus_malaysianus.AAC.1
MASFYGLGEFVLDIYTFTETETTPATTDIYGLMVAEDAPGIAGADLLRNDFYGVYGLPSAAGLTSGFGPDDTQLYSTPVPSSSSTPSPASPPTTKTPLPPPASTPPQATTPPTTTPPVVNPTTPPSVPEPVLVTPAETPYDDVSESLFAAPA